MSKGKIIVISGASGVGKSTILKEVMKARQDLVFSVSATTRPPRPDEVNGVNYHFITRETFLDMIRKGEFLEYDEHHAVLYGTLNSQILEKQEQYELLKIMTITTKPNFPTSPHLSEGLVCMALGW